MPFDFPRRKFLCDSLLVTAGAAAGIALDGAGRLLSPSRASAKLLRQTPGAEQRLLQLGIKLPAPPSPVAVYVPAVRAGEMLYASGHGPLREDGTPIVGKVGGELTLDEGYEAARRVGISMLSTVRNTLGSLDRVARLVKVLGMVNCTPEFTQQPQVINGFSELMVEVFGQQAGKGARSAVGMASLPGNIAVEIDAIFQVQKSTVTLTDD